MILRERVEVKYKYGSGWIICYGIITALRSTDMMLIVLGIDSETKSFVETQDVRMIPKNDIIYCKPITE